MKRLITICAVVGLMLLATSASWAVLTVNPPPSGAPMAPSWWNSENGLYAYGYWSSDIIGGGGSVSPTPDPTHWASNYLNNTDFTASIGITNQTADINLGNVFHPDLNKEIYIYITGDTNSTENNIVSTLNTGNPPYNGIFSGSYGGSVGSGQWTYFVSGVIVPQPDSVSLQLTVPGMTSVTNIWAGERCVPEPATIGLLGLGALSLLRRKREA